MAIPENPPTATQLFLIFTRIGLTSFGGGLSGWIFREFVQKHRWLTEDEFLSGLAISQTLPGVNVSNMAIWIGYRLVGASAAAIGLSLSMGISIGLRVPRKVLPIGIMAAIFAAIGIFHLPLVWVVLLGGGASILLSALAPDRT